MKLVLFKAREVSERPPRWGCPGQNAHAPPAHTAALTPRECGFGGAVGPSFLRPAVLRKWAEARTRLKSEYLNEKANQGQRKMFAKETAPPSRPPPPAAALRVGGARGMPWSLAQYAEGMVSAAVTHSRTFWTGFNPSPRQWVYRVPWTMNAVRPGLRTGVPHGRRTNSGKGGPGGGLADFRGNITPRLSVLDRFLANILALNLVKQTFLSFPKSSVNEYKWAEYQACVL